MQATQSPQPNGVVSDQVIERFISKMNRSVMYNSIIKEIESKGQIMLDINMYHHTTTQEERDLIIDKYKIYTSHRRPKIIISKE